MCGDHSPIHIELGHINNHTKTSNMYIFWPFTQLRDAVLAGSVIYRVTEEGLMDRLSTDMPESCLHVGKECR